MKKPVDTALLAVVMGVMLVAPPLILLFNKPASVFGVPLPVLYLFGVWLTLVLIACLLSGRLPAEDD